MFCLYYRICLIHLKKMYKNGIIKNFNRFFLKTYMIIYFN